jgi:hypothetical protein
MQAWLLLPQVVRRGNALLPDSAVTQGWIDMVPGQQLLSPHLVKAATAQPGTHVTSYQADTQYYCVTVSHSAYTRLANQFKGCGALL